MVKLKEEVTDQELEIQKYKAISKGVRESESIHRKDNNLKRYCLFLPVDLVKDLDVLLTCDSHLYSRSSYVAYLLREHVEKQKKKSKNLP